MVDEFLVENAALDRLLAEYGKYGSLTIGVDFDGTLHDYHKTGASHEQVRQLVRELKSVNCKIVIWTAYPDLMYVAQFCTDNNIPFDSINEGGIPLGWESKKPFFSALLDDRAGLLQQYTELKQFLKIITE
jgi:hypothetical protein